MMDTARQIDEDKTLLAQAEGFLRTTFGFDGFRDGRSEELTSELQSRSELICRLLLVKQIFYDYCQSFAG